MAPRRSSPGYWRTRHRASAGLVPVGWLLVFLAAGVAAGVAFRGRHSQKQPPAPRGAGTPPLLHQYDPAFTPKAPVGRHAAAQEEAMTKPTAHELDAARIRFANATAAIVTATEALARTGDHAPYDAAIAEQAAARANLEQLIEAAKLAQPSQPLAPSSPSASPAGVIKYGPTGTPTISGKINENDPAITRWRDDVYAAMAKAGVPPTYAMAWLAIESGGKPCAIGEPNAKGPDGNPLEMNLWQAYNPDDLKPGGFTGAELRAYCIPGTQSLSRAMTPVEIKRVMDLGVNLITRKRHYADQYLMANGITWPTTSPDYWAAVKGPHAYPPIINTGLHQVTQHLGRPPRSWAEFRATYEQIEPRARFDPAKAAVHQDQSPYFRGLENAEWVGFHVQPPAVS